MELSCPKCQKPVHEDWILCPFCNTPLPPKKEEKILCKNCQKELQKEWVSCPFCGTPQKNIEIAAPQQEENIEIAAPLDWTPTSSYIQFQNNIEEQELYNFYIEAQKQFFQGYNEIFNNYSQAITKRSLRACLQIFTHDEMKRSREIGVQALIKLFQDYFEVDTYQLHSVNFQTQIEHSFVYLNQALTILRQCETTIENKDIPDNDAEFFGSHFVQILERSGPVGLGATLGSLIAPGFGTLIGGTVGALFQRLMKEDEKDKILSRYQRSVFEVQQAIGRTFINLFDLFKNHFQHPKITKLSVETYRDLKILSEMETILLPENLQQLQLQIAYFSEFPSLSNAPNISEEELTYCQKKFENFDVAHFIFAHYEQNRQNIEKAKQEIIQAISLHHKKFSYWEFLAQLLTSSRRHYLDNIEKNPPKKDAELQSFTEQFFKIWPDSPLALFYIIQSQLLNGQLQTAYETTLEYLKLTTQATEMAELWKEQYLQYAPKIYPDKLDTFLQKMSVFFNTQPNIILFVIEQYLLLVQPKRAYNYAQLLQKILQDARENISSSEPNTPSTSPEITKTTTAIQNIEELSHNFFNNLEQIEQFHHKHLQCWLDALNNYILWKTEEEERNIIINTLLEFWSSHPLALEQLIIFFLEKSEIEKAVEFTENLLKLTTYPSPAFELWSQKIQSTLDQNAIPLLKKLLDPYLQLWPNYPPALLTSIFAFLKIQNIETAYIYSKTFLQHSSEDGKLFTYWLAAYNVAQHENQPPEKIERIVNILLKLWPSHPVLFDLASRFFLTQQKWKQALDYTELLINRLENPRNVLLRKIYLLLRLEQNERAVQILYIFLNEYLPKIDELIEMRKDVHFHKILSHPRIKNIFELPPNYIALINQYVLPHPFDLFYLAENVPIDKLLTASQSFLKLEGDEELLCYVDTTVWGSGKNGFALTTKGVRWKRLWSDPVYIPYSSINSLVVTTEHLLFNEAYDYPTNYESLKGIFRFLVIIMTALRLQNEPIQPLEKESPYLMNIIQAKEFDELQLAPLSLLQAD